MNFVFGFMVLLFFQFIGTMLTQLLHLPLPGVLTGLILLAVSLATGLVPIHTVEKAADGLLGEMGLFFVPIAVGLVLYADVLLQNSVAILLTILISTVFVLCLTGKIVDQVLPGKEKEVASRE